MSSARLLIVDDDADIRDALNAHLSAMGYQTRCAANAAEAREILAEQSIDLVVLDIMMPGEDGLSLCRSLRERNQVAIILLTALADDTDRIVGLEMGADDYLCKPFNPRELVARIKAVLRRTQGAESTSAPEPRVYEFDNWQLDVNQSELMRLSDQLILSLSSGETLLLKALLQQPNSVLSRDELMNQARGRESLPFERSIDNAISRLRRKIEIDPTNPRLIKTVWGGGYRLASDVKARG